jgi:hypothetical protein
MLAPKARELAELGAESSKSAPEIEPLDVPEAPAPPQSGAA